jgi:hypothetical protein
MFSKDLLERAAKTFLQAFFATLAATFAVPADFADGNWQKTLTAGLIAAISAGLSALSSFYSRTWGDPQSASMIDTRPGSAQDTRA